MHQFLRKFETWLARVFVPPLLRRQGPSSIPRTGEEGKAVNCFSISIEEGGKPSLLVRSADYHRARCSAWNGDSFLLAPSEDFSWDTIDPREIVVRHYFGLYTVKFTGVRSLSIGRTFGFPYLKIFIHRLRSSIRDARVRGSELPTPSRIEILYALRRQARIRDEEHFGPRQDLRFSSLELMTWLFGERWYVHADYRAVQKDLDLVLRSLVNTGELSMPGAVEYQVVPKLVVTLEEHEAKERKDRDLAKERAQARLIALVSVLVAAGLLDWFAEWGIVKLLSAALRQLWSTAPRFVG